MNEQRYGLVKPAAPDEGLRIEAERSQEREKARRTAAARQEEAKRVAAARQEKERQVAIAKQEQLDHRGENLGKLLKAALEARN